MLTIAKPTKLLFSVLFSLLNLSCFGQAWKGYDGGTNDKVNALAAYNGEMYAGGKFTVASNTTVSRMAVLMKDFTGNWKWFGNQNINGPINCMTVFNNKLYIGGNFTYGGSYNIAAYNAINGWSGVGPLSSLGQSGLGCNLLFTNSCQVRAFAVHSGVLFAAGSFSGAGAVQSKNIIKWDGASWFSVGGGIQTPSYGSVNKLCIYAGELYAAGIFTAAGNIPVNNIAKWNGTTWSTVANFSTSNSNALEINDMSEFNGELYVVGNFNSVNGTPVNNVAKFDGSTWYDAGTGLLQATNVTAISKQNNRLFTAGAFNLSGTNFGLNIAEWDGSQWNKVVAFNGGEVACFSSLNGALFVGGLFGSLEDYSNNTFNCSNVGSCDFSALTGTSELEAGAKLNLYPNPCNQKTTLSAGHKLKNGKITIYNSMGVLVQQQLVESSNHEINSENLPAGVYFVNYTSTSGFINSIKLLVEH